MLTKVLYWMFGVKFVTGTIIYKLNEDGELTRVSKSNFTIKQCLNCNKNLNYDNDGLAICDNYLYIVVFEE